MKNIFLSIIVVLLPFYTFAQLYTLSGVVKDGNSNVLPQVTVDFIDKKVPSHITNEKGQFTISNIPAGIYIVRFSHVGYKSIERTFKIDKNRETEVIFSFQEVDIDEVYITARESRNISTSSIINKDAMRHLQPSSFSDLLELLPGGRAETPNLIKANPITLRGFSSTKGNFQTNSMGTLFQVDGIQLNSSAMMGSVDNYMLDNIDKTRDMTTRGVDMRSIATDNIEKVEIIRGIPSVEYGDLTSGVIIIDRVSGHQPWYARFKADGFSKLFSVGKGFASKDYKFNIDGGFLNANSSPSDVYTNYKRVNGSIRGERNWNITKYRINWKHALDLNATIDNERFDPDNDVLLTDSYKNSKQNYSLSNTFEIFSNNLDKAFRSASLKANISYGNNIIDIEKLVQIKAIEILPNSLIAGSHEAKYLSSKYISNLLVEDKPITANLKLNSNWHLDALVKHQIKAGVEFQYAKNIGEGPQYDFDFPMNTGIQVRPRVYKDIPGMSNLAMFAEDRFFIPLGSLLFENAIGVRAFTLLNLNNDHLLNGKIALDPRWNGRIHLPKVGNGAKAFKSSISAGFGIQTLAPNLTQLYPNLEYRDNVELSYYHNNPAYRLAWVNTTIFDPTNLNLNVAKNKKWELSTFLEYNGNSLSITYFNEKMNSGFRNKTNFEAIAYRKYNVGSVDPNTITEKPQITDFTYTDISEFYTYSQFANGSTINKKGIEYQFSSKRIKGINTRFTVNGAWFRQENKDAQSLVKLIGSTIVTDGKLRQYAGIYDDLEGTFNEMLNTNLIADSYLPKLGLNLSISFQNIWYSSRQDLPRNSLPAGYYTIDGQYHDYLPSDREDVNLRHLDLKLDETIFRRYTTPIDLQVNVKASKTIKDKITIAMFVNKLFIYRPTYSQYGITYYRTGKEVPYFGMELNIKI